MPRLSRIAALARLAARHPGAIPALLRWRPFSITSFQMARNLRVQGIHPRTVLDGGANVGQFARAMVETFPQAEVVSFEPFPGGYYFLAEALGRSPARHTI